MLEKFLALVLSLASLLGAAGKQAVQAVQAVQTQQTEQTEQTEQAEPVSAVEPAYSLLCQLPGDAVAQTLAEEDLRQVYTNAAGDYELVLEALPGLTWEQAAEYLSGFSPDRLTVLTTQRFGMAEKHFVWYAASEETDRLCRAVVLEDTNCCYALSFSVAADRYPDYQSAVCQAVETLGLFGV